MPKHAFIAYYRKEKQGVFEMGLFMNKKQHPNIYKNLGALIEPNQVEYCINAFTEFVKEQKASNKSLNKAIDGVSSTQDKFHLQQKRQWQEMEQRIYELRILHKEHEKLEKQVMTWLQRLENKQSNLQTLIQNEQKDKKELLMQVQNLTNAQEEVISELNELVEAKEILKLRFELLASFKDEVMDQFQLVNAANEQMLSKMDEQTALHHQISDKITNLEETQKVVIDRVDGQEGIIEKVIHQIDNVRFILFERTNYLEDKIEKVYQQAVGYIQKVKNHIIQPSSNELNSDVHEENRDI